MAALCAGNAHHFAALWPDIEPFAEAGFIALTVINARSRIMAFGGHKGADIALMIEVLAAALTCGRFGFEDRSGGSPGAQTSNAGQFVLLIDPARTAGNGFAARVEALLAALREAGSERLSADARHARRLAAAGGIEITDSVHADLLAMLEE